MNPVSAPIKNTNSRRKWFWLGLLAIVVLGIAMVFIPIWLIMPFKPQTARGLQMSLILRRLSPFATILASLASITLIAMLWRGSRWFGKAFAVVLVLLTRVVESLPAPLGVKVVALRQGRARCHDRVLLVAKALMHSEGGSAPLPIPPPEKPGCAGEAGARTNRNVSSGRWRWRRLGRRRWQRNRGILRDRTAGAPWGTYRTGRAGFRPRPRASPPATGRGNPRC